MLRFERSRKYTRPDVKEQAGLSRGARGGNWDTGIVEHDGEFIIFANVGTEGRTGHDYANRWEGDHLRWYHKNGSLISWQSVRRLLERESIAHLFWRTSNEAPFNYAGTGKAMEVADTSPVEILWSVDAAEAPEAIIRSPEEMGTREYREGSVRKILVNAYERDRAARLACIGHFGTACAACGLRFEDRYGPLGVGFIHVHHVVPVSSVGAEYQVNPIKDLRPVCPNCHAMLHRKQPALTIEELRTYLR